MFGPFKKSQTCLWSIRPVTSILLLRRWRMLSPVCASFHNGSSGLRSAHRVMVQAACTSTSSLMGRRPILFGRYCFATRSRADLRRHCPALFWPSPVRGLGQRLCCWSRVVGVRHESSACYQNQIRLQTPLGESIQMHRFYALVAQLRQRLVHYLFDNCGVGMTSFVQPSEQLAAHCL